jgi:hypothetical protein
MTALKRVLKRFWFPILVFILGRLGRKYEWADKTHKVVKKVR